MINMEAGHRSETPTLIYQNRWSQTPQYTIKTSNLIELHKFVWRVRTDDLPYN